MRNSKKNGFIVSKMTRIWWILIWALENLKICTLIGSFYAKSVTCKLKKLQRSYLSWHWWRETDLWLGKDMRNMANFQQSFWKISNLGLWWDPLIQSRKCMNLKFTEEWCFMTMNNDANFEEELTYCFKIDMRNFTNFRPNTRKS